jgi:hypothetical protein
MRTGLALALLLLAACDQDPLGRCTTSAECPTGQLCGGGVCARPGGGEPNASPVALADAYAVPATGLLECPLETGLLANDADPDGDALAAERVGPRETGHGVVFVDPSGAFKYVLTDQGYAGNDVFLYRASDGVLWSEPTAVTLTIAAAP